jgi:hypothetical protein
VSSPAPDRRTAAHTTEVSRTLEELREALAQVDGGHGNPVGAARALQQVAARRPPRDQGQRNALRWGAEKELRPYFRALDSDEAAKAVVWLALDAAWAGGGRRG